MFFIPSALSSPWEFISVVEPYALGMLAQVSAKPVPAHA